MICVGAYELRIVPEHGSEVNPRWTVSNERLSKRAELMRVSALPSVSAQVTIELRSRVSNNLSVRNAVNLHGNNQGNLGDVSSVLSRSVCVVCMYICIYAIVTTFVGIIMLWTVSTIGKMFVWPCGSFGILCCVIRGKTFLKNETICEFFSCLKLPCQRQ
jgi:hypothetical protein